MRATPEHRAWLEAEIQRLVDQLKALGASQVILFGSLAREARYPNALEDVIPAEFYSDNDAGQAIAMAEAVMALVRQELDASPDN